MSDKSPVVLFKHSLGKKTEQKTWEKTTVSKISLEKFEENKYYLYKVLLKVYFFQMLE